MLYQKAEEFWAGSASVEPTVRVCVLVFALVSYQQGARFETDGAGVFFTDKNANLKLTEYFLIRFVHQQQCQSETQ